MINSRILDSIGRGNRHRRSNHMPSPESANNANGKGLIDTGNIGGMTTDTPAHRPHLLNNRRSAVTGAQILEASG